MLDPGPIVLLTPPSNRLRVSHIKVFVFSYVGFTVFLLSGGQVLEGPLGGLDGPRDPWRPLGVRLCFCFVNLLSGCGFIKVCVLATWGLLLFVGLLWGGSLEVHWKELMVLLFFVYWVGNRWSKGSLEANGGPSVFLCCEFAGWLYSGLT